MVSKLTAAHRALKRWWLRKQNPGGNTPALVVKVKASSHDATTDRLNATIRWRTKSWVNEQAAAGKRFNIRSNSTDCISVSFIARAGVVHVLQGLTQTDLQILGEEIKQFQDTRKHT